MAKAVCTRFRSAKLHGSIKGGIHQLPGQQTLEILPQVLTRPEILGCQISRSEMSFKGLGREEEAVDLEVNLEAADLGVAGLFKEKERKKENIKAYPSSKILGRT